MQGSHSSPLSIALADSIATGHVNAGLARFLELKNLPHDQASDVQKRLELAVPAITNMTLGLELLLKMICFQQTGVYPHVRHDIKKLGRQVPEPALSLIRAIYLEEFSKPTYAEGFSIRVSAGVGPLPESFPVEPDPDTYDGAIHYIGNAYVRWRYIFQELHQELDVGMNFKTLWRLIQSAKATVRRASGNARVVFTPGQKGDA